jgi:hypothetical protein
MMGKANKERRAAKKRKAGRRYSEYRGYSDHRGGQAGPGPATGLDLRWLLLGAAGAAGTRGDLPAAIWEAICVEAARRGHGGVGIVIDEVFCDCLESVWEGGWQPGEAARAVRRGRGGDHADLVATAIAASHGAIRLAPPPRWVEQLEEMEAAGQWWGPGRDWLEAWARRRGMRWEEALRTAAETLGVLMGLPATEALLPPPSQWKSLSMVNTGPGDVMEESILRKVRALLAKAESTDFEHEADALTAKAQELMARHTIDEAVARGSRSGPREKPVARRVAVDDPYARAKSTLLAGIASANSVRVVWDDEQALMTLVGFQSDVDGVDVLFTSLLMQASRAMLARGRVRDTRGHSRTRSFRQSFLVAFAQRIHERLVMAAGQARQDAEHDLGRSLLPVLAGRSDEVDGYTAELFPYLSRSRGATATNPDGWVAGRASADMATLGPVQQRLEGTG